MIILHMVTTVAIIVILGILLMILETFLPGMIAGILGVLCVLAGVLLVMTAEEFSSWPSWGRSAAACFIIIGSVVLQLIWLRFFAVKFWSRSFTLQAEIPSADNPQTLACGTEGVAITELRPLGRADFNGSRREVRSEDGFVPVGSRLCVTGSEPGNLLVRPISLNN